MMQPFQAAMDADLIGIGFGPAAISLACAIDDRREQAGGAAGTAIFYEQAERTAWHPELLLPGTDINHHVLRDLVTPRNPRSRFSFAMYLLEKGRLYKFGLLGRPASRHEWSDYVSWVAGQLGDYVRYDEAIEEVLPGLVNDRLTHLEVRTSSGVRRTRNLVLSCGSVPRVPAQFEALLGERVFHTGQYLSRIAALGPQLPKRWLVIGSGQSASETAMDLLRRSPDTVVHSLHRSNGFALTQLGQFPSLAFSPEQVDYFHSLEPEARRRYFEQIKATNYAGIDPDESQALYSQIYEDSIQDRQRLILTARSEVCAVETLEQGYRVVVRDIYSLQRSSFEVDAIVLATGYQQPLIPSVLATLQPWLERDDDGGLAIGRDYRVALRDESGVNIFVNGLSERTHGISDGQSFSLMAMRSQRILDALDRLGAFGVDADRCLLQA